MKDSLLGKTSEEIEQIVAEWNFPKYRTGQIIRWLYSGADFSQMTDLPKALVERLDSNFVAMPIEILQQLTSVDGTIKFLFKCSGSDLVEGVLMQHDYGNTLCVSTQVGCRMGCTFCASGKDGLIRNMTAAEILGQVIVANRYLGGSMSDRKITNIVLMGSGEPLDNYDNVSSFLTQVSDSKGLNFSERNISLSTCGLVDGIKKLADDGRKVTLSLSLHATTDESRRAVMPIANKYSIFDVIEALRYYYDKSGRRVVIEYCLDKSRNMNHFDAKRLFEMTRGIAVHINLIMLNSIDSNKHSSCTKLEAERFVEKLKAYGISCTIRRSLGSDIEGACGQLRIKYITDNPKDPLG